MTIWGRVEHFLDDQQRGKVALEVGIFLELAARTNAAVRRHSDFLAEFAQDCVGGSFVASPTTPRQAPAGRIAQLHQHHFPIRRQRKRVRSERARAADEPVELEQPVRGAKQDAQSAVGDAGRFHSDGRHAKVLALGVAHERGQRARPRRI